MIQKHTIYFRADGDGTVGFGHVVRSLALVNMLKSDFEIVFVTKLSTMVLESEILSVCSSVIWLEDSLTLEDEADFLKDKISPNAIVVIDGYNFKTEYQKKMKAIFPCLFAIDDLHAFTFFADVIINQSGKVKKEDYQAANDFKLCSGYEYLLLREPFLQAAKNRNVKERDQDVFICFGGADVHNITMKSVQGAILSHKVRSINVVIGSTYKFKEELLELKNKSRKNIEIHEQITADEMCLLMQNCSFAIAPSSGVSLELCSVGIGLISGFCADNQMHLYTDGLSKGVFIGVGDFRQISAEQLAAFLDEETLFLSVIQQQQKWFTGQSRDNFRSLFLSIAAKN